MAAIAEKAQHDPQAYWFLTWLTLPLASQSIESVTGEICSFIISTCFWGTLRVK